MMFMSNKPDSNEKKRGRPPIRKGRTYKGRSGAVIYCRVDQDLRDRLKKYVSEFNAIHPATNEGAVIQRAIREYLDRAESPTP